MAGAPAAGISACPPEFCPSSPFGVNTKPGWESPPHATDPKMEREGLGKGEAVKDSHPRARDGSRGTSRSLTTHCGRREPGGTGITHVGAAGGLAGQRRSESQPWQASGRKTLSKPSQLLGSETGWVSSRHRTPGPALDTGRKCPAHEHFLRVRAVQALSLFFPTLLQRRWDLSPFDRGEY